MDTTVSFGKDLRWDGCAALMYSAAAAINRDDTAQSVLGHHFTLQEMSVCDSMDYWPLCNWTEVELHELLRVVLWMQTHLDLVGTNWSTAARPMFQPQLDEFVATLKARLAIS